MESTGLSDDDNEAGLKLMEIEEESGWLALLLHCLYSLS